MLVLDRIFSSFADRIQPLVQEVSGEGFHQSWKVLTQDIDNYGQPKALLFGLRNPDNEYVGFFHLSLSYEWTDNGFHQCLLATATVNYAFITAKYRQLEDGVYMADLAGALAARQLAPETLYQSAPLPDPEVSYAADFPFRRLSINFRTRVIPSGGADSFRKFQQAFEKNIHDVTRKHPYMYWFNDDATSTDDEFDFDNPDFSLALEESDLKPWWELH